MQVDQSRANKLEDTTQVKDIYLKLFYRRHKKLQISKSHYEVCHSTTLQVHQDYELQKRNWEGLRERMRMMKIDIPTVRYKPNKLQNLQRDMSYGLLHIKQENTSQSKDTGLQPRDQLQSHYSSFPNEKHRESQIYTNEEGNSKTFKITQNTGSTDKPSSVKKVYKSKSLAPHYSQKIVIRQAQGLVQDLLRQSKDLEKKIVLERKTLIQGDKFYVMELSSVRGQLVIILNIMGGKSKRISLVLTKKQSKIIMKYYTEDLNMVFNNLVIGDCCLSLKHTFLKQLDYKAQLVQSQTEKDKNIVYGNQRKLITRQNKRRFHSYRKTDTSLASARSYRNRCTSRAKINKQVGLFEILANGDSDALQQMEKRPYKKSINNENSNRDIKQSIPNYSSLLQDHPNHSTIKEDSQLISKAVDTQKLTRSIVEDINDSIELSRLTDAKPDAQ